MKSSLATLVIPGALGHFAMQWPISWFDKKCELPGVCAEFGGHVGVFPGAQCTVGCSGATAPGSAEPKTQYCACQWYTNGTGLLDSQPTTIDRSSPLRTYMDWDYGSGLVDWSSRHPWRAPGTAPLYTPCGADGGNPMGCPIGNADPGSCAGGGYGHGPKAEDMYDYGGFGEPYRTVYEAGQVFETAMAITANHGGGYSFRLCPKPALMNQLTEECFQKTVLPFVGETQWVQFGRNASNRTAFPALTATGDVTFPKGSMWRRNPIPACSGPGGGSVTGSGLKCGKGPKGLNDDGSSGLQFPPPFDYGYGFGNHDPSMPGGDTAGTFMWSIIDKVQIPADVPEGDYVLSYRWDSEQTTQVWSGCADIRIVSAGALAV